MDKEVVFLMPNLDLLLLAAAVDLALLSVKASRQSLQLIFRLPIFIT